MTHLNTLTQIYIVLSSCAALAAAYLAAAPLLASMFALTDADRDHWSRHYARWQRLYGTSSLFRASERWIVGLSRLIEKRLPWFIELPVQRTPRERLITNLFTTICGRPDRLLEAVRICSNVQPWIASERVAAAILIGLFGSVSAFVLTMHSLSTAYGLSVALFCGWLAFRAERWRFIRWAESRRQAIRKFLPHAMDTLAMVISSGDSFIIGIDSLIRDFPEHPLSQEFVRLRNSLNRGQTKESALTEAAQSVCLPEFEELVRALDRIHKHGAMAADSFTRLAGHLRTNQLRIMEEEVGRAEANMALPTMFVMLACLIVAAAPFALSFMQAKFVP